MRRKKRGRLRLAVEGVVVRDERMPLASAKWLKAFINARSRTLGEGPIATVATARNPS
jgi:hypothetical protein